MSTHRVAADGIKNLVVRQKLLAAAQPERLDRLVLCGDYIRRRVC